ncbi:glycosyltransferase [Actinomadura viridis]|uniref:Cellulose synthase/poly-beta-1,6-N-acetylglucosamine synthase-like glycosyltransferase/peptidoglycan/xylan/chitin deacetylase (PgdA/CDA1 family) n=1 Tax=Actinomadura viridis TaxID=58110 RepID=A0A931DIJ0_9ACTN|nr:bifunctional polysaccharide deacetylase/glycosyltransferase family 2 protein [Actinomadura viridis]MBG6087600.1 cellulose synthase/poly-beta-1,6-N-acetylglucosamine synthase-like glycosyltransferase/peptidoglycan/xylan/chitin deacetylase (PgdA/CDA1 family) [Actinomadura viridis]
MKGREPRGHWFLLLLGGLTLFAALLLNGFAEGAVGESPADPGGETGTGRGPKAPGVPAAATSGGPVLDLNPGQEPRSVRPANKTIALTFDDGPDPRWTPRLLETLRKHGAQATFFVVGARVAEHPGIVRRMAAEGHELGNHTYTHVDMGEAPAWRVRLELDLTQRALAGVAGVKTALVRMPYSSTPASLTGPQWEAARRAGERGYLVALTDRDTKDWVGAVSDTIVERAAPSRGRPGAGAVVMMHDSGGDREATLAAVDRLLTGLSAKGYRFTTLSRAVGLPPATAEATGAERAVGTVLVSAQRASGWIVGALGVLFGVAAILTVARLALLLGFARTHVRRVRRAGGPRGPGGRRRRHWHDLGHPTPPLSIIVPAYNEEAGIEATVRSLLDTGYPAPFEVIVVDDGSTDRTAAIVDGLRLPGVRLITKPNGGKPSALNAGVAAARAEVVVLVDGDTVFQRDTLWHLAGPFADPAVGAVSGNTKVANRGGVLGRWQHLEYVIGFNLDRRMFDVLQCMPTIPGAIGAFRRQVLAAVGGVSDDTLAEDTDLTMAICRAGWRVVYEENALAWTEAPASLRQLWRQRYRWCYGTLQAMWKHRRSPFQRGRPGRFGRRCLSYLTVFQVVLPLFAPAVDLFTVYGLVFLDPLRLVGLWLAFTVLQAMAGAYALRLDGEPVRTLWVLPLQQVVYRQLMYLVVIQSLVTAVLGARLRWHSISRAGTFASRDGSRLPT